MEKVSWIQNGSNYRRVEGNVSNTDILPKGIYTIGCSMMTGWYVEKIAEEFVFDYKIYGLQTKFINHVLKTYQNTSSNLGILFNGTKGAGKTVSAKVLANSLKLPIIIVKSFGDKNDELIEYLSSFNFSCVLFFDEFEKNWSEDDCSILQIMDGAYNSPYRRIFLLTTNETTINDNLISRPSRIRYIKEFGNLDEVAVREYLNDNLNNKEDLEETVDIVETLEISTIDILKTIVEDINIHGIKEFVDNKDFFNIKTATYNYEALTVKIYDPNKYSIEQFIKDVKSYEHLEIPLQCDYPTYDAYKEAFDEHRKKVRELHNIFERSFSINKSFKNLKPGDEDIYYRSEIVLHTDFDAKVLITKDSDEDDEYFYYYIKNPNEKPSLFKGFRNPYVF